MKLTQTLVLTAQLAILAAGDYYPRYVTEESTMRELEGAEALSYLFDYDPSRRHPGDTGPNKVLDESAGPDNRTFKAGAYWSNYDTQYLYRICTPRMHTGEATSAWENSTLNNVEGGGTSFRDFTTSYAYGLNVWRVLAADSPYPCERLFWLHMECGINPQVYGRSLGTFGEQNKCLCDSTGFWEANQACQTCYDFHTGNATVAAEEKRLESSYSASICQETGTAAKKWKEVWISVRGIQSDQPSPNSTVFSDGAPGKTDVSLYYTGGVDFVPATIREPVFTRTVGQETIVMTPGSVVTKVTAETTGPSTGSAGGSAASPSALTAGALNVKTSGGLMVALVGALMML